MKRQIDRYVISTPLGTSGTQFLAEETLTLDLKRVVVLELLPPLDGRDKQASAKIRVKFQNLLSVAGTGGPPHIQGLLGLGLAEDTPWLALESLPGNLASLVQDKPAVGSGGSEGAGAAELVQRMVVQIAEALAFVHSREAEEGAAGAKGGLLHHNVNPESILQDVGGQFRLGGLGLVAAQGEEPTCPLHMVRFAAPELLQPELGKIGPSTDLYALGHVACLWALGRRMYRAQFPQVYEDLRASQEAPPAKWMQWHCSLPTAPPSVHQLLPEFPEALSAVLSKMMAKDQGERFASATDLLAALRATELGGLRAVAAMGAGAGNRAVSPGESEKGGGAIPLAGSEPAGPAG
ncbi:MAG: hypothetical protein WCI73_15595, partial [Phycisphaerae bacterium]